ncbi:hypothetical protein OE88DRAFT_1735638 [Heliocybe sulcata]|uniref:Actin-like ATPase domain-containing protein n=1 Tax=Heliocybe sulcata TaxID=5364 RepID=A0A5C3MZY5_9AGAM|nr:hypothetical protein OE88DRAFT_1735638 [Heliocybe sulcata]
MSKLQTPYGGSNRKLLIALDIGTTCSAVSYTILDPGEIPEIRRVPTFPGLNGSRADAKLPSVLYYNAKGDVQAVGYEAEDAFETGKAEDEDWIRVEWFKLHLRPRGLSDPHIQDESIPPIPENKTVTEVLADFLRYLFECAKRYITTTYTGGDEVLKLFEGGTEFVMGHPNGWGGFQQQNMRQAAVKAGLVPSMDAAGDRIQFVTEGEASLYYCLTDTSTSDHIKPGNRIMIVDAGGGTVDLSSYLIKQVGPIKLEEVASPSCRLQGSVFVDDRAKSYIREKLRGSSYDDPEDINLIARRFGETGKRSFESVDQVVIIPFGGTRDNQPKYGIIKGKLKLQGDEVHPFFNPSIEAILDAIRDQRREGGDIKTVFFVGGFSTNRYLFDTLRARLAAIGIDASRPDGYTNKAVADGAVAFYTENVVTVRFARVAYGTRGIRTYDRTNQEHRARTHAVIRSATGIENLPNAFHCILPKGSRVVHDREHVETFAFEVKDKNSLRDSDITLVTYSGCSPEPRWTDVDSASYRELGRIRAPVSQNSHLLQLVDDGKGRQFYRFIFRVVLKLGLTELKACIAWTENGQEKRSPISIVYVRPEVD